MNKKALKAGAAGIAKQTFSRKSGAHESRKEALLIAERRKDEDRQRFLAETTATVITACQRTYEDDSKLAAHQGKKFSALATDTTLARILHSDGRVFTYSDNNHALASYYALPKGCRAAFRGIDDFNPVYPWSFVDK